MKRFTILTVAIALMSNLPLLLFSQNDERSSPFSVGADLYSNYIFRGTKYGTGPAIQPYVEYSIGNLTIGSWGSYSITDDEAAEADLYLFYGFDFGLSVGVTDYYYPGSPYFDYTDTTASHAFEINLAYEIGNLSIETNYVLNDSHAGRPGSAGGDMYFEFGYSLENVDVFIGAGNGWHTSDGNFGLCNVGISSYKDIKISKTLTLPLTGSLILNPEQEQFYIVVGVSF